MVSVLSIMEGFQNPATFHFSSTTGEMTYPPPPPLALSEVGYIDQGLTCFLRFPFSSINSFASQTKADHSACRRGTSIVYSKSSLYRSAQLNSLTNQILQQRMMPILLQGSVENHPTELLRLSFALSLDLINCFIFGLRTGPNFTQDRALTDEFLEHYENRYCKEGFWMQELPGLTKWLGHFGVNMLPAKHYESKKWLEDWMMGHVEMAEDSCRRMDCGEEPEDPADIPVVYAQQRKAVRSQEKGPPGASAKLAIASELFDQMCKFA